MAAILGAPVSLVGAPAGKPAARAANAQPEAANDAAAEAQLEEKRRKLVAGLVIVAGILALGLALIVLVIVWGHRARVLSRKPLGEAPAGDPLWYLGSGKSPPPGPAGAKSDGSAGPERPPEEPP